MPPRKRFNKRLKPNRDEKWLLLVGTPTQILDAYGGMEEARIRWEQVRPFLTTNRGTAPAIYWLIEGPRHLRSARDFRPAVSIEDALLRWRELLAARRRWLETHG